MPSSALDFASPNSLNLLIFNVDQGDHFLFELPNGNYGIIDSFYSAKMGQHEPLALSFLKKVREETPLEEELVIEFLCITQPSKDHLKGIDKILSWVSDTRNNIKLENVWAFQEEDIQVFLNKFLNLLHTYGQGEKLFVSSSRKFLEKQLKELQKFIKDCPYNLITSDITGISLVNGNIGDGIKVHAMGPLSSHVTQFFSTVNSDLVENLLISSKKRENPHHNVLSVILLMVFGEYKLLFGGDVSVRVWEDCFTYFEQYGKVKLKEKNKEKTGMPNFASHFIEGSFHGLKRSSYQNIWRTILDLKSKKKKQVVFSAGAKTGQPAPETIKDIVNVFSGLLSVLRKLMPFLREPQDPTGGAIEINTTNLCGKCLAKENRYEKIDFDQFFLPTQPLSYELRQCFINSSMDARGLVDPLPIPDPPIFDKLGAFMYEFNAEQDEIKVRMGITTNAKIPFLKQKDCGLNGTFLCK